MTWEINPLEIAAAKINAGEYVGEGWVYGRGAVELMRSGKVSEPTLRRYRSALYFTAKKIYGLDGAGRMERDWLKRQSEAEALEQAIDREQGGT